MISHKVRQALSVTAWEACQWRLGGSCVTDRPCPMLDANPAGHVGVIDFFGRVSERTLKSGVNVVNPMARVIKMSVQTKEMREQMQVLSKEGLTIALELSTLYRLNAESAAEVYKTIAGGNFEEVILVPQFPRSVEQRRPVFKPALCILSSESSWLFRCSRNCQKSWDREESSSNLPHCGV